MVEIWRNWPLIRCMPSELCGEYFFSERNEMASILGNYCVVVVVFEKLLSY